MYADIQIRAEPSSDVYMVPKQAVIRTGNEDRVVLALGAGKFKSVPIRIGRVGNDTIEIIDGVTDADTVVTSAQFLLDSESNKAAELTRMTAEEEKEVAIWAQGIINHVMTEQRLVKISHGPIEALGMMGMTMHFELADSIDITTLAAGQELHFRIVQSESGMYQIVEVHIMAMSSADDMSEDESSDDDMHHH